MMRISTRGRYALRIMIDLARQGRDVPVSLRGISERENITIKYMEGIVSLLLRNGLLTSVRGKDGGYQLSREPQEYTAYDILCAAEGDLAPVQCLEGGENTCPMQRNCATLPFWQGLERVVGGYLKSVTLADLMASGDGTNDCKAAL